VYVSLGIDQAIVTAEALVFCVSSITKGAIGKGPHQSWTGDDGSPAPIAVVAEIEIQTPLAKEQGTSAE